MLNFLKSYGNGLMVAGAILIGVAYFHFKVMPEFSPDGPLLHVPSEARAFTRDMNKAYARNARDVAAQLRAGSTLADASKGFAKANHEAISGGFASHFSNIVKAILPEGTEPNADQREKVARFYEQLADGVDKGPREGWWPW